MERTLSVRVTEAVDKFVDKIKEKYRGRRIIQEDQLLNRRSEKLVRLELVERERLQASEQRGNDDDEDSDDKDSDDEDSDEYSSDDEDSNVTRTHLAYADLFKVKEGKKKIKKILIDGDAGIGKTTFCIAVCEDWADGKIFQEFELVLLLPLREQEVASAGSLVDLLKVFHLSLNVCELVKDYFEEYQENILVIADGWDELGSEKRDKGTFLYRLLFGRQYSSVSTIVTSRPSASASLHHGKFIDRFAEIRGFDKKHMVEYINAEFADDQTVASDILEKLESNPLIKGICSIPLNCAIICHLWQTLKGDLPTTMTGLYTKIILNIILRSIHKFPIYENIVSLSSFDDLPESLQQSWWLLCEFAFQTLMKDQLVFSGKELVEFFPQGLSPGVDIHCFGLLQSSVSMLEVGCGTSFHFLHLTFQEYLAALFLVKRECCQVTLSDSLISGLMALFNVPVHYDIKDRSDSMVLRFFFGIAYSFEIFQNGIGQRILTALSDLSYDCLPGRHFLCHWAFEAHNDQFVRIVVDKLNYGTHHLHDAKYDFVAVMYVVAKTPEFTDKAISLYGYGLHDYHLIMLTDLLSNNDGKLQVKSLELKGCNKLTDRGMTDLFSRAQAAFQSLEDLSLNDMVGGEYIYSILATGHCRNLKDLDLSTNNLCAPGGRALGEILPQLSLETLDVSNAKLGDEGMSALNQGLESTCHIGHLNLGWNDIHAAGISCLADSICAGKMVIKHHLCLIENPLGLKGAEAVVRLLSSKHFQAEHVMLDYCGLTTAEDDSAHSISPHSGESISCVGIREWACRHKIKADSVKSLCLLRNNFFGEGIHVLAGFMYLCPQLRSLCCGDCNITSNDLEKLLPLLSQSNLKLERWVLSDNNLDDDGVSALIEHLPKFPSLTDIDIYGNDQISSGMCRNLKDICEKVSL
jgi:Ran GTPase-activating protein (RanGAP) involved in mRNA processing and transport